MNSAKDEVRKLLDRLPDEVTLEDIQYQVYFLDEIARGTEQMNRGEIIPQEEVRRRMAKWLRK